ncbi:MAG: hypothetical protein R3C58_12105 [Parvularculaceae bacterium]
MLKRILALFSVALCFLVAAVAAAQTTTAPALKGPLLKTKPPILITARYTSFRPATHGYKFANSFANNFVSELDIRTDGLCGGMAWSALDYWAAGKTIPQQTYEPAEGSVLRDYIYDRQVNSLADNADKWAELLVNPGGARNDEFWRWGLEGKPGGRIDELKKLIDAGKPAAIGLLGCSEGCKGDHQVVAYGYDLGRYKGDLGANMNDFRIFIYDVNFPGEELTLRVDTANKKYYYEQRPDQNWRTYFVDSKWRARTPPNVGLYPREVLLTFKTGEDDLRGGNDNVHAVLTTNTGRQLRFNNINRGKRWISYSSQTIALPLPNDVAFENISSLRLETTFGGGVGGDNWDLDRLVVEKSDSSGRSQMFARAGSPLVRFTGSKKNETWSFSAGGRELAVTFWTGGDDLRGDNDNVHFILLLRNGSERRFNNVNERRKWANGTAKTVYLPMPAGVVFEDIVGFRLETTFSGGMGGDNWDLNKVRIDTRGDGSDRKLYEVEGSPLFRFTGDQKTRTWRF